MSYTPNANHINFYIGADGFVPGDIQEATPGAGVAQPSAADFSDVKYVVRANLAAQGLVDMLANVAMRVSVDAVEDFASNPARVDTVYTHQLATGESLNMENLYTDLGLSVAELSGNYSFDSGADAATVTPSGGSLTSVAMNSTSTLVAAGLPKALGTSFAAINDDQIFRMMINEDKFVDLLKFAFTSDGATNKAGQNTKLASLMKSASNTAGDGMLFQDVAVTNSTAPSTRPLGHELMHQIFRDNPPSVTDLDGSNSFHTQYWEYSGTDVLKLKALKKPVTLNFILKTGLTITDSSSNPLISTDATPTVQTPFEASVDSNRVLILYSLTFHPDILLADTVEPVYTFADSAMGSFATTYNLDSSVSTATHANLVIKHMSVNTSGNQIDFSVYNFGKNDIEVDKGIQINLYDVSSASTNVFISSYDSAGAGPLNEFDANGTVQSRDGFYIRNIVRPTTNVYTDWNDTAVSGMSLTGHDIFTNSRVVIEDVVESVNHPTTGSARITKKAYGPMAGLPTGHGYGFSLNISGGGSSQLPAGRYAIVVDGPNEKTKSYWYSLPPSVTTAINEGATDRLEFYDNIFHFEIDGSGALVPNSIVSPLSYSIGARTNQITTNTTVFTSRLDAVTSAATDNTGTPGPLPALQTLTTATRHNTPTSFVADDFSINANNVLQWRLSNYGSGGDSETFWHAFAIWEGSTNPALTLTPAYDKGGRVMLVSRSGLYASGYGAGEANAAMEYLTAERVSIKQDGFVHDTDYGHGILNSRWRADSNLAPSESVVFQYDIGSAISSGALVAGRTYIFMHDPSFAQRFANANWAESVRGYFEETGANAGPMDYVIREFIDQMFEVSIDGSNNVTINVPRLGSDLVPKALTGTDIVQPRQKARIGRADAVRAANPEWDTSNRAFTYNTIRFDMASKEINGGVLTLPMSHMGMFNFPETFTGTEWELFETVGSSNSATDGAVAQATDGAYRFVAESAGGMWVSNTAYVGNHVAAGSVTAFANTITPSHDSEGRTMAAGVTVTAGATNANAFVDFSGVTPGIVGSAGLSGSLYQFRRGQSVYYSLDFATMAPGAGTYVIRPTNPGQMEDAYGDRTGPNQSLRLDRVENYANSSIVVELDAVNNIVSADILADVRVFPSSATITFHVEVTSQLAGENDPTNRWAQWDFAGQARAAGYYNPIPVIWRDVIRGNLTGLPAEQDVAGASQLFRPEYPTVGLTGYTAAPATIKAGVTGTPNEYYYNNTNNGVIYSFSYNDYDISRPLPVWAGIQGPQNLSAWGYSGSNLLVDVISIVKS